SIGTLILLYLLAPLGALIPLVAGLIIYNFKETDRDGNKYFVYSDGTRQHGLMLIFVGSISLVVMFIYFRVFR
ncbi:MAG: hypothetical protein ABI861_10575, partial [Panacibacter sp.]